MMRAAIVDDERCWRETIKKRLEEFDRELKIDLYVAGEEFLKENHPYDIVFMDIELGSWTASLYWNNMGRNIRMPY